MNVEVSTTVTESSEPSKETASDVETLKLRLADEVEVMLAPLPQTKAIGSCYNAGDGKNIADECAERWDAVNVPGSTYNAGDDGECVCLCAGRSQFSGASIEIDVARCASAPGCSRVSTATVSVARPNSSSCIYPVHTNNSHGDNEIITPKTSCTNNPIESTSYVRNSTVIEENKTNDNSIESPTYLRWGFKNGRLVFDVDVEESENDTTKNQNVINKTGDTNLNTDVNTVLSSKELNKRIDENRSRLRNLENKLKTAGIKDEQIRTNSSSIYQPKEQSQTNSLDSVSKDKIIEQVVPDKETCSNKENINYDANQNIVTVDKTESQEEEEEEEIIPEDVIDLADGDFCQFDVRQVAAFPSGLNGYCDVYDELEETDSDDEDVYAVVLQCRKQTNSNTMGTDSDRPKHNPDTDNLKSLLKRPGRNKDRKSNRVVFNENKNEFFDADYIILIREECDYDDEDEDGVCTCNQHEMVRLTCCEPNCNCSVYDGFEQAPQSPKFAPPLEFVDAVTLSPPEGYKDMELGEQQLLALQQMAKRGQRAAVCKECSASHEEHDDDGSQSDEGGGDQNSDPEDTNIVEKEKTDQSQQTTPTTPINDTDSTARNFPLENVVMTSEQRMMREAEDERNAASSSPIQPSGGSPISGILKGGKLWKQQSLDGNAPKFIEPQQMTDSSITSDEEGNNRRSVRFIESNSAKRDGCDGAPDNQVEENSKHQDVTITPIKQTDACNNSTSPESTEMMLTFKLGNHVLISNNSLKPNSAVRQLFPCTKPTVGKEDESIHQYLVTAESLRAFEEAKRFKLPQIIQSGETDDSIERAIERNTLRRSLIRYEPRNKKPVQKTDNSLVERIKQLTCDVDDINQAEEIPPRISPPGEEARNSPEITAVLKNHDKSFSPSSSSTTSSNSSSTSSTYKKITDLFAKRDKPQEMQNNLVNNSNETTAKLLPSLPDLGNGPHELEHIHLPLNKLNSTNDSRKQFLSTLAPLTACVSGLGNNDEHYYHMNNHVGDRTSVASSVGTEYSLEDIDEALRNGDEDPKRITPDVLAGTPSASEAGDELAMFVQQDASRIERIKKKYLPEPTKEEDDEHDDYGFNKRPSVRGIKPRFGTTTEIIQQIQNQLQPPMQTVRVAWPYYSESGLSTTVDNSKSRNINQNLIYQYPHVPEEVKARGLAPPYRPTSLQDETLYQNSSNQTCPKQPFNPYANPNYSPVMKVDGRCSEYYQSLPRPKNGRPQSPPPLDMSKTFHQTMVYIPYNHIEGYQPTISPNPYYPPSDYSRVSAQNQINKRYIEPIYQQRIHQHMDEHQYRPNMLPPMPPKQMIRAPFPIVPQPHMINSRSESPLPGQFSTARSTQTPVATLSTCNYYATQPRYRPMVGPVWQGDPAYVNKMNRHSFPMGPRYATSDNGSVTDSDSQHSSGQMPNGYRQSVEITFTPHKDSIASSPTKSRFIERGVPEGAASVSSQDSTNVSQSNSSTMTSPTSPQNPPVQKPLFYAMNV